MTNLSISLTDLGRREEALSHDEEAVGILRQLALLARSLGARSLILIGENPAEARAGFAAAIMLLTPYFLSHRQAHAPLMRPLCRLYLQTTETLGLEPDVALLKPIAAIFQKLKASE